MERSRIPAPLGTKAGIVRDGARAKMETAVDGCTMPGTTVKASLQAILFLIWTSMPLVRLLYYNCSTSLPTKPTHSK